MAGVFNDSKKIEDVFVQDIPVAKISLQNKVVYAGYSYPCVSRNNLNPITIDEFVRLPWIDKDELFNNLYLSNYINSIEFRVVGYVDDNWHLCELNKSVNAGVYGTVTHKGDYIELAGMLSPRYIYENVIPNNPVTLYFKINDKIYDYKIIGIGSNSLKDIKLCNKKI